MGKRDKARIARIKAGTEAGVYHNPVGITYVKCNHCGVILPDYRVEGHFEKYHPHIKLGAKYVRET
jgi:hypothetical protein